MLESTVPPSEAKDLKKMTDFWTAAIGALTSSRSSKFGGFRSKVSLEKDVPMEWYNYQKDVMESGALGTVGQNKGDPVDSANGDYKGF